MFQELELQATSESEVQLAAIDSIITATLTNSTQENSDGSNSSRASSPSPTNNNDLLVLLQSFIKTMDKKYTDVSDQLKNMGKLVFPKDVLDSHFKELSTRTETFIRLEHHHLMLNNHLENDSAPTSLGIKSFPKPNFQDFGFSQDYIDKFNIIINTCQRSLIELNVDALHQKMDNVLILINGIKSIISDVTDIKINVHMTDLENKKRAELKPYFDKSNENFIRLSTDPFNYKHKIRSKTIRDNLNTSIELINDFPDVEMVAEASTNHNHVGSKPVTSPIRPSNPDNEIVNKNANNTNKQKNNKKSNNSDKSKRQSIPIQPGSPIMVKDSNPTSTFIYPSNTASNTFYNSRNVSNGNSNYNNSNGYNKNTNNNTYMSNNNNYKSNNNNNNNYRYNNNTNNTYKPNNNNIVENNMRLINGPITETSKFRSRSLSRRRT